MKKIAELYGGTSDLMNANIASKIHLHNYAASCKNKPLKTVNIKRLSPVHATSIHKRPYMGDAFAEKFTGIM